MGIEQSLSFGRGGFAVKLLAGKVTVVTNNRQGFDIL